MRSRARIEEILAKHTGQPLERIRADIERDYFIDTREVLEYGLIDDVLERRATMSNE